MCVALIRFGLSNLEKDGEMPTNHKVSPCYISWVAGKSKHMTHSHGHQRSHVAWRQPECLHVPWFKRRLHAISNPAHQGTPTCCHSRSGCQANTSSPWSPSWSTSLAPSSWSKVYHPLPPHVCKYDPGRRHAFQNKAQANSETFGQRFWREASSSVVLELSNPGSEQSQSWRVAASVEELSSTAEMYRNVYIQTASRNVSIYAEHEHVTSMNLRTFTAYCYPHVSF